MNFDYSEDEVAIKDQARRYLAEHAPLSLCRDMLDGKGGDRAAKLWAGVSELGWPGVAVAEADGGVGMGQVALCALAEEVGRAGAPVPLLPSIYLAAQALTRFGDPAQKSRWLPSIACGSMVATAFIETDRAQAPRLSVAGGRLTGRAAPVGEGMAAGIAIVEAASEQGRGLYLVDLTGPGVARGGLRTIDDSRPQGELRFEAASAERLPNTTGLSAEWLLDAAAVLVAFEQLGGAEACLEMARAYVLERRSFGRVVGSYQAVKHQLAEMYVAKELARSNAYYAAWALAEDAPALKMAASVARVSATQAYELAAAENIQLHGGIGYTWEADPQLHYRRSRLLAQILGPIAHWQDRLVAALAEREEGGDGF
jgi:alkylation response protein AidB-like acyl-CoA dehydrogenase